MRPAPLLLATLLLVACSDPESAQQDVTPPAQETARPSQQSSPNAQQQPASEQADLAAAEAQPKAADPCDLSGYDMQKMTADRHEELVKVCENSKQ